MLSKKEATILYIECQEAINSVATELKKYIKENPHFSDIGNLMLNAWEI